MANWIIGSLLLAWFLTWFDFDILFINGFKELFGFTITNASYYLIFFIVGVIFGIVEFITGK